MISASNSLHTLRFKFAPPVQTGGGFFGENPPESHAANKKAKRFAAWLFCVPPDTDSAHIVADVLAHIQNHKNCEADDSKRKGGAHPRKFIHLLHPVV